MKIRDFLKADFDVNTNIKIFDGTDKTWEEAKLICSGYGSPADVTDEILDMDIKYITTDGDCIVIEGKCSKEKKMLKRSKKLISEFCQHEDGYRYAILQVSDCESTARIMFSSIKELERMGEKPDIENYEYVYESKLPSDKEDGEILAYLYMIFNSDERPTRTYHARSMSVSDVVLLNRYGKVDAYFVDSIGFTKLPDSFLDL